MRKTRIITDEGRVRKLRGAVDRFLEAPEKTYAVWGALGRAARDVLVMCDRADRARRSYRKRAAGG